MRKKGNASGEIQMADTISNQRFCIKFLYPNFHFTLSLNQLL